MLTLLCYFIRIFTSSVTEATTLGTQKINKPLIVELIAELIVLGGMVFWGPSFIANVLLDGQDCWDSFKVVILLKNSQLSQLITAKLASLWQQLLLCMICLPVIMDYINIQVNTIFEIENRSATIQYNGHFLFKNTLFGKLNYHRTTINSRIQTG